MSDAIFLITVAGAFLAIAAAIVIMIVSRTRQVGILLSAYLMCIALALVEPLLIKWDVIAEGSLSGVLLGGHTFLFGPLLYLYCRYQSAPASGGVVAKDYFHFVPFVVYLALVIMVTDPSGMLEFIVYEIFILHVIGYSIMSLRYINHHGVRAHINKDTVLRIRESFLRAIATLSVVLFALIAVISNTGFFVQWELPVTVGSTIQVVFVLYVLTIVFLTTELLVNQKFMKE